MIFDLRSECPAALGLGKFSMRPDARFVELLRTAVQSSDEWVTFLHENIRGRGIYANVVSTHTESLGLCIRRALRQEKTLHPYVRPSTIQHDHKGSTTVRLRKIVSSQTLATPPVRQVMKHHLAA